jgi:hypothetical protein
MWEVRIEMYSYAEEKNGFSLHGFSLNSQPLNDIPSRSLSNINETGQGRKKLQEDIPTLFE